MPSGSLESVPHDHFFEKLEAHSSAGLAAAATTMALPAERVSTISRMGLLASRGPKRMSAREHWKPHSAVWCDRPGARYRV
jgi:hypothetical protein